MTETLTRLPAGHPIAAGPDAPVLMAVNLGLLAAFLVGLAYQIRQLRVTPNSAKPETLAVH
jgi:hypothetical protein